MIYFALHQVDFQNCVIGSPIIDLFYFLTTSVAYEIYSVVRDELIYTYHETLTAVLNKFNYQGYVPTLNELQIEMVKRGMLELYLQLTVGAYIRTPSPRVTPAVQPLLYKQEYLQELKDHGKTVLGMFKPFFIEQLHHFDLQGTLDYKGDSKRVSGIKGRWSGKF